MQKRSTKRRVATAVASIAALGLVAGTASADGSGPASEDLPGDRSVPFWPHETGALMGTSETFVDVHADSSYYDPSVGRRVFSVQLAPKP